KSPLSHCFLKNLALSRLDQKILREFLPNPMIPIAGREGGYPPTFRVNRLTAPIFTSRRSLELQPASRFARPEFPGFAPALARSGCTTGRGNRTPWRSR